MEKMSEKEKDALVRVAGFKNVDTSTLTKTGGNTYVGETEVAGETRFYEIKVVAKNKEFSKDDLTSILEDNRIKELAKAEKVAKAMAKAAKDAAKRAEKEAAKKSK